MAYTNCQSGRTAAIARYASFAQITCSYSFLTHFATCHTSLFLRFGCLLSVTVYCIRSLAFLSS